MGLSSSQARLLNMTSRMHQIEYKAAKLEAQKLQMANESRRVYEEYLDALEATKIQVKTIKSDGSASYKDINKYSELTSAGFQLFYIDASDNKKYKKFAVGTDCKTPSGNINIANDSDFTTEVLTNLINSGSFFLVESTTRNTISESDTDFAKFVNEELTSVAINTNLQEVPDESQLRKAEAKYEADMRKIDAKDRKYDADLAALDTERNAIKSEMETLKTVARDNVERTFKLFS